MIDVIEIHTDCLIVFEDQINQFGPIETGGTLLGYVDQNKLVITKATDPGPKAIHKQYYFRADPDYTDMLIDMEYANSNGKINYRDEWHTHPQISPMPSDTDLDSLERIADTSDGFAVLVILGAIDFQSRDMQKHAYALIKERENNSFYHLNVVVKECD